MFLIEMDQEGFLISKQSMFFQLFAEKDKLKLALLEDLES